MFQRKGLAAAAVSFALAVAPSAYAQSLSEALASAYNNSGLLEQNRALLRAADEGVAQSVAATLPVINWSAQATSTRITSPLSQTTNAANARITGSLTLYDGGANQLAIEAQKEVVLGTRQALRRVQVGLVAGHLPGSDLTAAELQAGVPAGDAYLALEREVVHLALGPDQVVGALARIVGRALSDEYALLNAPEARVI